MDYKKISFSTHGQLAEIAGVRIHRMLPNRYADAVGPFVFLDYIPPSNAGENQGNTTGPHPHRGIATLTYILDGEAEHFDSRGHHSKVRSGGVQWMKAGNGIVHDEKLRADAGSGQIHGFQFWINLPSKIKAETPEYVALQGEDIPKKEFDDKSGWIKVITGEYEELRSKVPGYSKQYLFHIHLEAEKSFVLATEKNFEYAALLPSNTATINGESFGKIEFIEFDREDGRIKIKNHNGEAVDVLIFGGERYTEPIVADGPFVMNSRIEIGDAHRDFFAGKYGEINYNAAENK